MSNELNITGENTAGNIIETSEGENTGVTDNNKIVSIANKTGTAVPDNQPVSDQAAPASDTVAAAASQVTPAPALAEPANATAASQVTPAPALTEPANTPAASVSEAKEASAAAVTKESGDSAKHISQASCREDTEDRFDFDEDEERPRKRLFRSRHEEESRDKLILSRIRDDDLLDYLTLEQRRLEFLQQAREIREKRILTAFQLLISLAAIVAITYLLKDNPTILISILYIVGIIAALIIWKNPRDKGRGRH